MKIILEYEIDDEDYKEFLKHDLVENEPLEFFNVVLDDYVPAMLVGFEAKKED